MRVKKGMESFPLTSILSPGGERKIEIHCRGDEGGFEWFDQTMKQRLTGMNRSMAQMLEQDIQSVLDAEVRPLLHAHDGDIELTGIDEDRVVRLRLLGACATCMGAEQTVNDIIVASIRQACPSVADVRVETGVSHELIAEALRFLKRERQ